MTTSLGTCGAVLGMGVCPGDVIVSHVVGAIAEGRCSLCSMEFAAPVGRIRNPEPEADPDFLEERGAWWQS